MDDATHLETPAFPSVRHPDAVRLHFQSRFVPEANVGTGHASLYRPELLGRVTVPISDRTVMRFSARGGLGRYEFRGADAFRFAGRSLTGGSLDLFRTRLDAQGAVRLNHEGRFLLREGELWSVLGGIQAGADFENGAFSEALSGGAGLAVGYELDGSLRLAAGFSLETSARDGGVGVSPTGSFRWNVTDAVTLRDRGLGMQLEVRLTPALELFASGFRETDHYRLRDIRGVPDELTLRDRRVLAGAGFEWKVSRRLRVNTELGAVASRKLRVRSGDAGTLVSQRADDPSAYFEVRLEVRP